MSVTTHQDRWPPPHDIHLPAFFHHHPPWTIPSPLETFLKFYLCHFHPFFRKPLIVVLGAVLVSCPCWGRAKGVFFWYPCDCAVCFDLFKTLLIPERISESCPRDSERIPQTNLSCQTRICVTFYSPRKDTYFNRSAPRESSIPLPTSVLTHPVP